MTEPNSTLDREMHTFGQHRQQLEESHPGEHWVLIRGETIVDVFPDFQDAARHAIAEFGAGPYMIRQIKTRPVVLPSSIMLYDQAIGTQNG